MDEEIKKLEEEVKQKQELDIFKSKEPAETPVQKDNDLMNKVFNEAVQHSIMTDEELQTRVLDTAKKYTETKMDKIATDVDTEFKEANFNNKKDACESYGFNEKTTPVWATNVMTFGYNIVLAIWLFIGTFTFMPIIFIAKKISVAIKTTWITVLISVGIYLGITFLPLIINLLKR